MKKKLLLYCFFSFLSLTTILGQSKRANVWYFAYGVGINFNCTPPCYIQNGALPNCFSSSSICDNNGNLQFYSNNQTIWSSNHQVMENGDGLYSCPWSAQGSLIVPLTNNQNQYYLVTCDNSRYPPNAYNPGYNCTDINPVKNILSLHLIDMSYNNGQGKVLWKNKVIYNGNVNAMLAGVKHANTKDTWLLTYDNSIKRFISLLLTDCGIQDTNISRDLGFLAHGWSPIKFSPKGDLFHVWSDLSFEQGNMIAHFNTTTGEVTNPFFFRGVSYRGCFSTNSRYFFGSGTLDFKNPRYDLSLTDTAEIYLNRQTVDIGLDRDNDGLQNSPDRKIYYNFNSPYITWHIIDDPLASTFSYKRESESLNISFPPFTSPPNFVQSWFDPDFVEYEYGSPKISYQRVCAGDKSIFKATGIPPATNYHWEISENNLPVIYYYNQDSITHLFSSSGKHTLKLSIDFSCIPDIITRDDIFVDALPDPDYIKDTTLCTDNTFVLQAEPNQVSYLWNTGNTTHQQMSSADNTYSVSVTNTCGTAIDSVTIDKVTYQLYNLITPNHDGLNETFEINSNTPISGNLVIYNSWGSQVYKNASYKNTWPEEDIDSGIYYYEFTYSTCKTDKGWVQVIK
jgi:hypothetical protein